MNESFWEELINRVINGLRDFAPRLIFAVLFLVIGYFLIRIIMGFIRRIMDKAHTELSIRGFIESLSIATLYALLIYIIGRTLGVDASSFIAIFTAAGVAIGLALQGSLANFAGGLLILWFKPFKIGDEVEIDGISGEVDDINILYTRIHNWRGEYYTFPNGSVANDVVKNNTRVTYRRVQVELHFSFDEDIDQLREIIISTMKKHPKVIQERPFQFWINNFQDYYIKTSARCWCKSDEYWGVYWAQEEALKKALEEHGIELQIPKQEIHQPDIKENKQA